MVALSKTIVERFRDWWQRRARWQKVTIVVFVVLVVIGALTDEGDETTADGPNESAVATTVVVSASDAAPTAPQPTDTSPSATALRPADESPSDPVSPATIEQPPGAAPDPAPSPAGPAATSGPQVTVPTLALPGFVIVEEEDLSFPGAVRISLRIVVDEGMTGAQLRVLAAELAQQYRASHEYQAFNIFFYHFPELAFNVATLGVWDDSPYGDWARANEVARGDYSNHQPNDKIKEKDWSLLPTDDQVQLWLAYNDKYDEMDTDPLSLPSDDDVFAAVAADRGYLGWRSR